jgi:hypothetical protein
VGCKLCVHVCAVHSQCMDSLWAKTADIQTTNVLVDDQLSIQYFNNKALTRNEEPSFVAFDHG